ncbi:MAG: RDD family protein [Synergistaceae bacterium]|nr:RDD family protein [Synergistaceae bacterium]
MASRTDRVSELFDGVARPARTITSPEGVNLNIHLAGRGERAAALALDLSFISLTVVIMFLLAILTIGVFLSGTSIVGGLRWDSLMAVLTIYNFISFLVRVMYFAHFELAWQGRTPGKKICGIRVIDRRGGSLTPNAIIARNLTREVEIFLPMSALFSLAGGGWSRLLVFAWTMLFAALPLFNRDRLRAGDYIAGTVVIRMPRRRLLRDLTSETAADDAGYSFTADQLSKYGAFELQVLEELLRRPQSGESDRLLANVTVKICGKIGLQDTIPPHKIRRFLNDFYAAERAALERGQLFGHFKDDKNS